MPRPSQGVEPGSAADQQIMPGAPFRTKISGWIDGARRRKFFFAHENVVTRAFETQMRVGKEGVDPQPMAQTWAWGDSH